MYVQADRAQNLSNTLSQVNNLDISRSTLDMPILPFAEEPCQRTLGFSSRLSLGAPVTVKRRGRTAAAGACCKITYWFVNPHP